MRDEDNTQMRNKDNDIFETKVSSCQEDLLQFDGDEGNRQWTQIVNLFWQGFYKKWNDEDADTKYAIVFLMKVFAEEMRPKRKLHFDHSGIGSSFLVLEWIQSWSLLHVRESDFESTDFVVQFQKCFSKHLFRWKPLWMQSSGYGRIWEESSKVSLQE